MRDQELLELAAKAEDREPPVDANGVWSAWVGSMENGHWWNPLDDDGDALRLAMKLSISIDVSGMFVHADCRHCENDLGYFEENIARNDGCIFRATRRAIVRAAAGIGEIMP